MEVIGPPEGSEKRAHFTFNFERGFDDFYFLEENVQIDHIKLQQEEVQAYVAETITFSGGTTSATPKPAEPVARELLHERSLQSCACA